MERLCHVFRIQPGTEEEYVRLHAEIWPEMVEGMKWAGFSNYSLFRSGLSVIAYAECDPDIATCFARFGELDVGPRWQESMKDIVTDIADHDGKLHLYAEDWHLP